MMRSRESDSSRRWLPRVFLPCPILTQLERCSKLWNDVPYAVGDPATPPTTNIRMNPVITGSTPRRSTVHDVIISGAGPVGLFLACELALARCSVLILEKAENPHSPLKQIPFGIRGLSAPTIEALYRRGLLDELEVHKRLKNPHKTSIPEGPRRQGGHFAGIPFLDGNIDASQWRDRLPGSTETSLISEMAELESVLTRRAEALGVQIRRGIAITDFQQTGDGVTVQCGAQSFQGKWLVGCDGSRSVVRKAGGFEFAGTEPEFTGYSARVDLADPEKLGPGRNLTPTGMYFQSQPGYLVMLEFDGGAAHRAEPPTLERVQEASAPRLEHRRDDQRSAVCHHLDGPGAAGHGLPQRTGASGRRRRAHPRAVGRPGTQPRVGRRHEPGLEARRHHPRESAGRLVGQLPHRTASGRRTGAGLVTRPGGHHEAKPGPRA